jgi:hypothetical protein
MTARISETPADAFVKRLPGSHDASHVPPGPKRDREPLGGVERLLLALVGVGLKQSALRPAAWLVHELDIGARERALIASLETRHQGVHPCP